MKNIGIIIALVIFTVACKQQKNEKVALTANSNVEQLKKQEHVMDNTIYQFKVEDLYGNTFDFASLRGKKIMIVNTASECGLTPQYEGLQKIYDTYKDKGFVIVGFPANNFGQQEPGTNQQIASFCKENYGVTFPMMAKISVKGEDMHPIYQFLTSKSKNEFSDSEVAWNFQKYLIDVNGKLVKVVSPKTLPTDDSIVEWITK